MENSILDRELEPRTSFGNEPAIKDNRGRAKAAIILLWIMAGMGSILVISCALQFKMWWDTFDEPLDLSLYNFNFLRQIVLSYLYYLALIVSSVFFIRWFRRAYMNLHIIDNSYLSHSEGWAAGAWFVPVLNWIRPYKIMREICEHSAEHAGKINSKHSDSSKLVNLTGWWWALWVIYPLVLRSARYMADNTAVIKLLLIATGLVIAGFILEIVCALLAIRIIRRVSAAEEEIYEQAKREKFNEMYANTGYSATS